MIKRQQLFRLIPILALSFGVLSPLPASANAQEVCVDGTCTVTFQYTGQLVSYSPPQNAKNLSFEVYGAQGGRSGGTGGLVTGQFREIPNTLYIAVGGEGLSGSQAAGGFNGGGVSGTGGGVEGSGGGASDIRTGTTLQSRVVVAGGGGGRGAGLGSNGGAGGGLVGADGKIGQALGGTGGSQISGGSGGSGNWAGTPGGPGSLGQGGFGGQSSLYGGGGGGGGYFGGGGGGGDTDPCCADAGGGGGGSSYANATLTTNVSHTQAVRIGSGLVVLSYQRVPEVTLFSAEANLTNKNSISYELTFSSSVQELTDSDFVVGPSVDTCSTIEVQGSGSNYLVVLSGCKEGEVLLSLSALSVTNGTLLAPEQTASANLVTVDISAPIASLTLTDSEVAILEFNETITGLTLQDFLLASEIQTCEISELENTSPKTWSVTLSGCGSKDFDLTLNQESISDSAGNLGPVSALSAKFVAPVPEPEIPAEETDDAPENPKLPLPEENQTTPEPAPSPSAGESESDNEPALDTTPIQNGPPSPGFIIPDLPEAGTPGSDSPVNEDESTDSPSYVSPAPAAPTTNELNINDLPEDSPPENTTEAQDRLPAISVKPPVQAAQSVIVPEQNFTPGFGSLGLVAGLVALGVFGILAGFYVARRGIPGALIS